MLKNLNKPLATLLVIIFVLGFLTGRLSAPEKKDIKPETSVPIVDTLTEQKPTLQVAQKESEESEEVANISVQEDAPQEEVSEDNEVLKYVYFREKMPKFRKVLRDLPNLHMEAARALGLKEIAKTREDVQREGLVLIDTCEEYMVDRLTHSIAYLTPGAAQELKRIGERFQQILQQNSLPRYRIVVTSILRTTNDIKRLRRAGNRNALENSPHCYGTTFDISYVSYDRVDSSDRAMDAYELKKVLAKTLIEEREKGNVYVKYERKQPCFHITSRL